MKEPKWRGIAKVARHVAIYDMCLFPAVVTATKWARPELITTSNIHLLKIRKTPNSKSKQKQLMITYDLLPAKIVGFYRSTRHVHL
ncbi:MAG: hypothetical protein QXV01_10105 [Candidatus Bathyarchaeia archaeon]